MIKLCLTVLFLQLVAVAFGVKTPLEIRLDSALARSAKVINKYHAAYNAHYAQCPGYFQVVVPQFDKYHNESNMLKTAYDTWKQNKTVPFHRFVDWFPGMIFDTDEEDLSRAFARTSVARLVEQEKRILNELAIINHLIATNPVPTPQDSLPSLLNQTTSLSAKLRQAICKLNYTHYLIWRQLNSSESQMQLDLFDLLNQYQEHSELLSKVFQLDLKFVHFVANLKRQINGPVNDHLVNQQNQQMIYFRLIIGKTVKRAEKLWSKVVDSKEEMDKFKAYLLENGFQL